MFRRVDLRPQPADPKSQVRNVDVELQEGRPLSLLYGVGYQYAPDSSENRSDPFALVGVSYNNLFGRMQSIGFEAQYAPISQRGRFTASFREPYLFNSRFPLTILTYYRVEPIQDIDIRRLGTIVETSQYYGKYLRVALRYAYERIDPVNPSDISNIEKENFPSSDRPILQSTIGPNIFYDRRDDIIDPHVGYYVTAQYKYAFPFLSAEARYHKISGQGAHFWQSRQLRRRGRPEGRGDLAVRPAGHPGADRGAQLRRRALDQPRVGHGPARHPGLDGGLQRAGHAAQRHRHRQLRARPFRPSRPTTATTGRASSAATASSPSTRSCASRSSTASAPRSSTTRPRSGRTSPRSTCRWKATAACGRESASA